MVKKIALVLALLPLMAQAETNTDKSKVEKIAGVWQFATLNAENSNNSIEIYELKNVTLTSFYGYVIKGDPNIECRAVASYKNTPYNYQCEQNTFISSFGTITNNYGLNFKNGKLSGLRYLPDFGSQTNRTTEVVSYTGIAPSAWYTSNGEIIIFDVNVNGDRFWAKLKNQGAYNFSVADSKHLSAALENNATYDKSTGIVTIPKLVYSGDLYEVTLQLLPNGLFGLKEAKPL